MSKARALHLNLQAIVIEKPIIQAFVHKQHNYIVVSFKWSMNHPQHSHGPVTVNTCILQILSNFCEKYVELLLGPAQYSSIDSSAETFQASADVFKSP